MSVKLNLSYMVALVAGAVVALACRYYSESAANARLRAEAYNTQQLVENLQPKLAAKRQQLQAQQEKLNKGSEIAANVGPAVVADIKSTAERMNNQRLRDLLSRHPLP
ncbi:MAG: hypothetical protein EBS01_08620 [Verrucomicrobia bacterium]|nr:hypothetical protein [Verrucomicrobiota bacterium]